MVDQLLSVIAETVSIRHHYIALMAQEAGYYIDAQTGQSSTVSRHDVDIDARAHVKISALVGSAFEHGILEQLMGSNNPGVSRQDFRLPVSTIAT